MMYGAVIDNINTLEEYGLVLLDDVSYGTPEPRIKTVTIPEADGVLDLSEATSGAVRFGTRKISFRLFAYADTGEHKKPTEESFAIIRQRLMNEIHGKRRKLWLPDDTDHYYEGRFSVGEKGPYNSGIIPITVTADPWRYKNEVTERLFAKDGTFIIQNEKRPARPFFVKASAGGTVTFKGVTKTLLAGENSFDNIIFGEGANTITFSGITGSAEVTVKYQEGTL